MHLQAFEISQFFGNDSLDSCEMKIKARRELKKRRGIGIGGMEELLQLKSMATKLNVHLRLSNLGYIYKVPAGSVYV
jgi:hypothetical protein